MWLGIEVVDADLQAVVRDEQERMQQRGRGLSPDRVDKTRPEAAKPLNPQHAAEVPVEQAVDAVLRSWQQATTAQTRSRAVQDWMQGMERIEKQGGDVTAANAHTRKVLGGAYDGFMRQVDARALARQRAR